MVIELELTWLNILLFSTATLSATIAAIDLLNGTALSVRLKSTPREMLLLAIGVIMVSLLLMLRVQQAPYIAIFLGIFWLLFFIIAIILQYRRIYPDNVG